MDREKREYLTDHPVIKRMMKDTKITLADLLAGKVFIVPAEQPGDVLDTDMARHLLNEGTFEQFSSDPIRGEYWPLAYSTELDDAEYDRIKDAVRGDVRLVQDAALLVWSVSNTPRTDSQKQLAKDRITAALVSMRESASKTDGQIGGKMPKRRKWADGVVERLKECAGTARKEDAWDMLPDSHDAWDDIETDADVWEIYRDGEKLVARSTTTGKETALKKSAFLKNYYKNGK
jgi:hypothetical protein